MTNLKCCKCGSEKVIPGVDSFFLGASSGGDFTARVGYANPDALVFSGPIYAKLKANICGECGYTELVAKNPAALYKEYLECRARSAQ